MKNLILISILFTLSACTTTEKLAHKSLKKKNYSKAIMLFSKVLDYNPDNDDAVVGLNKARNGWIDSKLIKVRMLRLAGNESKSTQLLNDIYKSQNEWNTFPKGPAAFTQKEETEYATKHILKQSHGFIENNFPLKAFHTIQSYGHMFSSNDSIIDKDKHLNFVNEVGSKKCTQLKKSIRNNEYYFASLINKYCSFWSQPGLNLNRQRKYFNNNLINYLNTKKQDIDYDQHLNKTINQALKNSLWYNEHGKEIMLNANSAYNYNHTSKPKTYTHAYTVSVPYKDSYVREKSESSGGLLGTIGAVVNIVSALSGDSDHTTDNGDGTETVYETRYRDESRYYDFTGTQHIEKYKYTVKALSTDKNFPFKLSYKSNDSIVSDEHPITNKEINLYTKPKKLLGPALWLEREQKSLKEDISDKLNKAWFDRHCHSNNREFILRCTHNNNTTNNSKNWFNKNFGLQADTVSSLLGGLI